MNERMEKDGVHLIHTEEKMTNHTRWFVHAMIRPTKAAMRKLGQMKDNLIKVSIERIIKKGVGKPLENTLLTSFIYSLVSDKGQWCL